MEFFDVLEKLMYVQDFDARVYNATEADKIRLAKRDDILTWLLLSLKIICDK